MSKVSLKALSEHLGLAEGTVSRAINDYPDIAKRTRERVKRAANELGYRPNSIARRLATGNAECVGYVLPWRSGHLSDPFLAEMLDGLSEALSARHWDLTLAVSRSEEDELAIIRRLANSGRVSGLVISRTLADDPRIDTLRDMGIPFVSHGRTAKADTHAWFDIDNVAAFDEAVRHLAQLGHERIAHIRGPLDYNFVQSRLAGYRRGLAACALTRRDSYEVESDMSEEGGYAAMSALLMLDPTPTAVVCVSDMVALGAMKALRERGLRPGRHVSVIGYDGLPIGKHTDPPLSTMAQPLQQAGKKIGDMLLAVIDGDDPANHHVLWKAKLVSRETDGPPMAQ